MCDEGNYEGCRLRHQGHAPPLHGSSGMILEGCQRQAIGTGFWRDAGGKHSLIGTSGFSNYKGTIGVFLICLHYLSMGCGLLGHR